MGKTKRIRETIVTLLNESERPGKVLNTRQLLERTNDRMAWGATMNQMSNILSKDIRFEKAGEERIGGMGDNRHGILLWRLTANGQGAIE